MDARRHIQRAEERRVVQPPGIMRRRPLDSLPPPDHLESKIVGQAAEIEQLAGDNHRLAATRGLLRQDLVAAQEEVRRLKAHIRNIQTESDIKIRILVDKIAKMESDIKANEIVKRDLKEAHEEVQSLVKARQELDTLVQEASQDLQKVRADVKSLPDLLAELDNLRHEHRRLRATFEYEKGLNIEKVQQLQAMEQNLIGMAREVETLRGEVLDAEKRTHDPNPYGGGYSNYDPSYPAPVHGGNAYVDAYGRPLVQMRISPAGDGIMPYGGSNGAPTTGAAGGVTSSNAAVELFGGTYDPSLAPR